MGKFLPSLLIIALFLSGCNLAGDITPPPGVATAQAIRPTVGATDISEPTTAAVVLTPPKVPANLQNGKLLFSEKCSPCHGAGGLGNGPQADNLPEGISPSPLGDKELAFISTPTEWFSIVTVGNIERFMPGFSSLTDAERWDVVAYALSLSFADDELVLGEAVYQESCADCHGNFGEGTEIGSTLTDPSFFSESSVEELKIAIRDGIERQMPGFGDELSDSEITAVSVYILNLALIGGGTEDADEIAVEAGEPASGAVVGQIINGTIGSETPVGIEVTLHGFEDQQEVLLETTSVDETGAFTFGESDLQPGWILVATMEHQGVLYGSEIVEYTEDDDIFLPLTVYDTSTDLSPITVDRLHTIFRIPVEGVLEISEVWIISNYGDRTLATLDGVGILEFTLPEGVTNLRFDSGSLGDRFISTEGGFVDRQPLRPGLGAHEVVVVFELPFDKRLEFSQPMDYPVDDVVMMTPASGPDLEGEGIVDMGTRELGESLIHSYSTDPIRAGGLLEVRVEAAGSVEGSDNLTTLLPLGIGFGSLILAAVVVGTWWFRRREPAVVYTEEDLAYRIYDDRDQKEGRDSLLRAIANLDNDFEAGEMEELPYQERRSELKAKLLKLMQDIDHD